MAKVARLMEDFGIVAEESEPEVAGIAAVG
jgi:hypothetical protein